MATVQHWSGVEVRALRDAKRMSIREFAAHLGVSERMISKWEAGGESITPRPVNQAALDTCLTRSDPDTQARFSYLTGDSLVPGNGDAQVDLVGATETRHPVDGRLMVKVEGSVYLSGPSNEPVWVPDFYIDVHPVTNAEYSRFVAATGHTPPQHWVDGTYPERLADHPVVFVTWNDATAYANWAGKGLPTSQQWEKAARGTRGTVYPWGDQPTPAKCNVRENGVGETTAVDCYQSGVSPYGVYDLCGNVWEWCSTETKPGRHELKGAAWTSPFNPEFCQISA
ncbi:Formylglycine-generating enzyme, required for sulfatase activity, contains SUMF1/FGE domain [Haloechinothrix alba]|uniref:Formylglycine-generating enzyme, required for sulfatase activity, contains SUMF1/FGE domain n=1 Tax=Haloechinothrix alba TaxID=664784 RepID=A0A238V4W3_9PSEU|nr:SUMF1/EgtB/PvdO family nonheme iron enzyme [Haloechinothrix alba]SNR29231.1 Formylglycine-generating enzyme, required for sulfatase activity, contains SUMF1/FGE domain [Haloechinothrix alba]